MSGKEKKPFRPSSKISRLQFSDEERADPALEKPLKKVEKAADKLETAQAKIPKQKRLTKESTVDAETGRAKVRLFFEETDKPKPSGKLSHNLKTLPGRELLSQIHKEIREGEGDNVGVEAVHKTEQGAEFGIRRMESAYHIHKLKPYRQLAKAEKHTMKTEVNYLYQKSLRDNPQLSSNPLSRWQQKQVIKKQYAAARSGKDIKSVQKTAENTKKTIAKMAKLAEKTGEFVIRHLKVLLIILAFAALLFMIIAAVSSCSVMFEGGLHSIVATSYTSEDADLIAVEGDYTALEAALSERIKNIEREYPGYDEYRYDFAEIGHNPHELAAYLTALLQTYQRSEVQGELQRVFEKQYKLTTTKVVEVRYRTETRTRTWTDSNGKTHTDTYTVKVPYNYYILNVKLQSKSVKSVAEDLLSAEQLEMFRVYLETSGNKPLIFGGGSGNVNPSTDLSGVHFENGTRPGNEVLVALAKTQVGNVGGQPYWSWYGFNSRVEWCACFVSWCLNQAGYSEPRFAGCASQGVPWFQSHGQWAKGNYTDLAPGDVIFFDWEGDGSADHVGIVIGTDGTRVYTVEGNSGDACHIRDYSLNSNVIYGYGLMN
ncbi:MAG: CHAP domain-containing protein [Anaerotignum sp.]|nr:CHAP domain-containing protein [Anaerotignum sp.]